MRLLGCLLWLSLATGCSTVRVDPDRDSETAPNPDPKPNPDPEPEPEPEPDPDPDPEPGPAAFCKSTSFPGEPGDAVLAMTDEHVVRFISHDGTVISHPAYAVEPPAGAHRFLSIASGGDLIAVSARWAPEDDIFDRHAHAVWYTRKGVVVGAMEADTELEIVLVTDDGTTIFARPDPIEGDYLVRRPDGSTSTFTGFTPYGKAIGGGWLRGHGPDSMEGFFHPDTLELRPIANDPQSSPRAFEEGYAYLATGKGAPLFVRETLDGISTLPLSGIGQAEEPPLWLWAMSSQYALLRGGASKGLWRADLTTGAALPADMQPPAGSLPLDDACSLGSRSIASDGQVIAPVRDGGAARLTLHDPITGTFTAAGLPVTAAGTFDIFEVSGTFIVHAGDDTDTFCPIVDWEGPSPEGSIDLNTTQIVRPSTGSIHVIADEHPWALAPSADGTCVAIPQAEATGWSLLDIVNGEEFTADGPEATFLWLE